ncbi:MAG: hypothetical protein SGJ04_07585 [Bacteroidota bacterium]|nr:hypothetical protein [Bacteroidota bacterium]
MGTSCKKTEIISVISPKVVSYQDYMPSQIGLFRTYAVDSFKYNGNSDKVYDTVSYFIKEICIATKLDSNGMRVTTFNRQLRTDPTDKWQNIGEFNIIYREKYIVESNQNLNLVKLIIPPEVGKTWNPNDFNNIDTLNVGSSKYATLHKPWSLPKYNFDSTTTVELKNDRDFINRIYEAEVYAYRVGLIRFEKDSLDRQPNQADTTNRLVRGFKITKTLIEYGK